MKCLQLKRQWYDKNEKYHEKQNDKIIDISKLKMQEWNFSLKSHIKYFNHNLSSNKSVSGIKIQNCTIENLDNIYKEMYKRFIIPFYIPILILISTCLIIYSKESINYSRYRLVMFLIGLITIIFSET